MSTRVSAGYFFRLKDERSVQEVPMGGVPFVTFQQIQAIGTSGLGSCSAVIIASRLGAILAHIPPLPLGNHAPGAGDMNAQSMMSQVQALFNRYRAYFRYQKRELSALFMMVNKHCPVKSTLCSVIFEHSFPVYADFQGSMDVRLPSDEELVNHHDIPVPCRTAPATMERLRSLCRDGNLKDFQDTIDSLISNPQPEAFDIVHLHDVMMEAIQQDREEFVSTLLHHGFPISPHSARIATLCKAKRVLECFLKTGWDINEPIDVLVLPALCYAVKDAEMTSWLLDHGANPNTRCEVDCTPLSYAVRNAHISVIELMLDRGGDVQKGQLLQHAVFREEGVEDVITLLVDRGAPLNATMFQDEHTLVRFWPMSLGTALHIAAEQGKPNAIRHLIRLGVDPGVKDSNGDTALEWAHKRNKPQMVQLLKGLESHL